MARQGGQVQLEQSDMHLALNMAKMAKGGFSHTTIEEMQYLIKKSPAEVWEEKKLGVAFPGHKKVKAAIERHLATLHQNHTHRFLLCQNGIAKNPQTCWRRKGTGASPPNRCREPTPEPTPSLPRTPPLPRTPSTPPSNNSGLMVPKSSICRPDIYIHILLFPLLNILLPMYMPRIASTIQILIQIC